MDEVGASSAFWKVVENAAGDPELSKITAPKPTAGQRPPPLEISEAASRRLDEYRIALARIDVPVSDYRRNLRLWSNIRFLSIVALSVFYLVCVMIIIYMLRGSNDLTVVLGTHTGAMVLFLVAIKMLITSDQKRSLEELRREREEGFISAVTQLAPNFDSKTLLIVLREMAKFKARGLNV